MNPHFRWLDDGQRFICNFCHLKDVVPDHYFCGINNNYERLDQGERNELKYGVYDIIAPPTYCQNLKVKDIYLVIALECTQYTLEEGIIS